jgi:hypothetical protein
MARFQANPNFAAELEAESKAAKRSAAEDVASAAKSIAPVDIPGGGSYRDGIEVVETGGEIRVEGTDWKSHWIEWGSVNNPVFAPLRRAVRAVGLRLTED